MTNKEKYLQKLGNKKSEAVQMAEERLLNREWVVESQRLASKILTKLDNLGWTAKDLANNIDVSPQYISKLLKGNEKFGFDILVKLHRTLDIPILSNDNKLNHINLNRISTTIIAMSVKPSEPYVPKKISKVISVGFNTEYHC